MKFISEDPFTDHTSTVDSIHAKPAKEISKEQSVPGRCDTAYINEGAGTTIGTNGMSQLSVLTHYQIVNVWMLITCQGIALDTSKLSSPYWKNITPHCSHQVLSYPNIWPMLNGIRLSLNGIPIMDCTK
jgi:hypothetical protein